MAEGTAGEPIVMTSESDDIAVGQSYGSSLTENVEDYGRFVNFR